MHMLALAGHVQVGLSYPHACMHACMHTYIHIHSGAWGGRHRLDMCKWNGDGRHTYIHTYIHIHSGAWGSWHRLDMCKCNGDGRGMDTGCVAYEQVSKLYMFDLCVCLCVCVCELVFMRVCMAVA